MTVKQTKIKIDTESDFPREITLIEQPLEMQIQISQDEDEAFIDLQLPEVADLHKQLGRFLADREALAEGQWFFTACCGAFNALQRANKRVARRAMAFYLLLWARHKRHSEPAEESEQ